MDAKTYCPVCERTGVGFTPLPDFYRQNSLFHGFQYFGRAETIALDTYACMSCGASDRERLYAWWINMQIESGALKRGARVVHFAPEAALVKKIRKLDFFDYETADFMMDDVDFQVDIMDIPFDDEYCDFFICSHVLEHVSDDNVAVSELARITRKGGCGILMAPICVDIDDTLEDQRATSDGDRWRLFGQNDHVRLYSHRGYINTLESNGFVVQQLGEEILGENLFSRLGLSPTSILYIVTRPEPQNDAPLNLSKTLSCP
ncbi:MAG: class I SAM-dependent methyltransferase [Ferrovum sp.]|nr:class I SAM-dependent methyltransferase [Ferrovum sp.]NDU86642.1 class I SAM-dependent methyltransferase [Ferrovum sp.]